MSYTLTSKIPTLPIIYSNPEKGPPLKRSLPVVSPGHSCCLRSLLSSIKYMHIIVESLEITLRLPCSLICFQSFLVISAYCGGLWLASLRVMQEIAVVLEFPDEAKRYAKILSNGKKAYHSLLWNGN